MERLDDSVVARGAARRGRGLLIALAIALLMGLPLRLFVSGRTTMVSRDTVGFIWYAQSLPADPLRAMREHAQHPAYPAMILAAHGVIERLPSAVRNDEVRSWVGAAIAVSMLGGLAVIVASYLLGATLFDANVGMVAAVLAACAAEFCQLSADGLTDMPHLAVYLLAVWAGVRGFQSGGASWFALTGALAGLGYLLRPEGAETAVATAILLLVPRGCGLNWRQRLVSVVCVVLAAGAVAGPYMLATGKLVQKKPIGQFVQQPHDHVPHWTGSVAQAGGGGAAVQAIGVVGEDYARSLRGTYLVPFIIWLIGRARYPGDRGGLRLVQAVVVLHVVILVLLLVRFDYWELFSLRHVMVLAGLTLPMAAAGVVVIIESLPVSRQGWAAVLLGAGLVGPTLPWMFQATYREDAAYRTAAAWMRANTLGRPRVMTAHERLAFYAYGDYIRAPWTADARRYLRMARETRPDWLAFDERRILKESPTFFEDLAAAVRADETLELARVETTRFRQGARRVLVYRYGPAR